MSNIDENKSSADTRAAGRSTPHSGNTRDPEFEIADPAGRTGHRKLKKYGRAQSQSHDKTRADEAAQSLAKRSHKALQS